MSAKWFILRLQFKWTLNSQTRSSLHFEARTSTTHGIYSDNERFSRSERFRIELFCDQTSNNINMFRVCFGYLPHMSTACARRLSRTTVHLNKIWKGTLYTLDLRGQWFCWHTVCFYHIYYWIDKNFLMGTCCSPYYKIIFIHTLFTKYNTLC